MSQKLPDVKSGRTVAMGLNYWENAPCTRRRLYSWESRHHFLTISAYSPAFALTVDQKKDIFTRCITTPGGTFNACCAAVLFGGLGLLESARSGERMDAISVLHDLAHTALLMVVITVVALIAVEARDLARQRSALVDNLERRGPRAGPLAPDRAGSLWGPGAAINAQLATGRLTASEAEIATSPQGFVASRYRRSPRHHRGNGAPAGPVEQRSCG